MTAKAGEKALEGDGAALKLCLERLCPPRKERAVRLTLPRVESAQDLGEAMQRVLNAASRGELTPGEAQTMINLLEARRKVIETIDLEQRLARLEDQHKGN